MNWFKKFLYTKRSRRVLFRKIIEGIFVSVAVKLLVGLFM